MKKKYNQKKNYIWAMDAITSKVATVKRVSSPFGTSSKLNGFLNID